MLKLKGENVTMLNASHPEVAGLAKFRTQGEVDAKAKKREADEKAKDGQMKPIEIVELWKPHGPSAALFEDAGAEYACNASSRSVLTLLAQCDRTLYCSRLACSLQHVRVDEAASQRARAAIRQRPGAVAAAHRARQQEGLRRRALPARRGAAPPAGKHAVVALDRRRCEACSRFYGAGSVAELPPACRKGALKPINVTSKFRQGKRPVTLLTSFEPFGLDADWLGEELRRICAGATSGERPWLRRRTTSANEPCVAVTALPGKSAGKEVLVQGKQVKAVAEFLLGRGIPKKWIETADLTEKK